ncbi:6-phosphogluconolactonase [Saccharopolyspora phatthalungensis]|uniref:6-phosphogluconolactonase n=1 Tax=Saccharopolyspora phatthalungensis TaxID=664693 RepID=A0A840PZM9_9PSEU|nr:6-phosphogluconolactonase [Saccharopolyspora phatthalungensis]MBB5152691.1 6-phosphogluconolactonase [Saccharopolyspora phatthalungensis]
MSRPEVIVHPTAELLVAATAARLITKLIDTQVEQGVASLVLTGGRAGIGVLEHINRSPARDAVEWEYVDVYWGDERFLPDGDPDRNETQARRALLDHVPVDPGRVHPMAPPDGKFGADVEAAAAHYAEVLATTASLATDIAVPYFDVLLLGVGEEGHTASLFPNTPYVQEIERTVVGVHDCPKPPPTRISLTLPAIQTASEVWLVTTGTAKAEPVAATLGGAKPVDIPVAGAYGQDRTLWLLDLDAASAIATGA